MTSPTQPTTKTTSSNFVSTEDALYFVEDIMGRAVVPFVLLGEVAKSVVDNLDREVSAPIEIGIRRQHYTQFAQSILPMFLPPDTVYEENKISFEHKGTPVTIRIIKGRFGFLLRPNEVFYKITHFSVPNPFDKYWKVKQLVK